MATYKFEQWNIEIVDPELTIVGLAEGNPRIPFIDFPIKKYSVNIILKTDTAKFGLLLEGVQSVSLNWEDGSNDITAQVWERLGDFEV